MADYYNPYTPDDIPQQPEVVTQPRTQKQPAAATSDQQAAPSRQKENKKKKPAAPKPVRQRRESEPMFSFVDKRLRLFAGVVLMLLALYAFCVTGHAFLHAGADEAKVAYNSAGQIVEQGREVTNIGGVIGAMLAKLLLTDTLGIGSFVLILYVGALGAKLVGRLNFRFWPMTLKCLILSVVTSVVLGLVTYQSDSPIVWGGQHGRRVNELLIDYTSWIGAACFNVALVVGVVILYLTELTKLYLSYRRRMESIKQRNLDAKRRKEQELEQMQRSLEQTRVGDDSAEAPEDDAPATDADGPEAVEPENDEFIAVGGAAAEAAPAAAEGSGYAASDELSALEHSGSSHVVSSVTPAPVAATGEPTEFVVEAKNIEEAETIQSDTFDPTAELSHYRFPSIDLLKEHASKQVTVDAREQEENKERIIAALKQFNIEISSIKATVGPTITLFEVVPAEGQRINAIKRVEEDLALALKAMGIRIIAPIPGKGTVGIEVPNNEPQVVSMRSIIASKKFQECKYELPMALGATISNEVFIADLTKMPHLLVAGATGQGKSVGLNAIITSLLYKKHPAELKFVLVDPKMVEFSLYRVLEQHYLAKLPDEEDAVITDPNKVVATLNSLCLEMDNRYSLLSKAGCRGVKEYNQKFVQRVLNPEKGHRYMPYIVVVVDEFADLIMQAGKEVEAPICRLAQKARAVGIHVIIATQRPSTNVITGLIKANFPGRIAFRVAQMVDSKTILDRTGAHQLVGKGDMFFSTNGNLERVQCAFVDTPEVEAICESIANQPGYAHAYILPEFVPDSADSAAMGGQSGSAYDRDPLFEEAAQYIVQSNSASTSSLQRRYSIGYNRAGKLMDQLEAAGVVGSASGSKPRQVLMDPAQLDMYLSR
jgi:S-DNA-T family DNA segregation ATPase FtsK/SpoIIIE